MLKIDIGNYRGSLHIKKQNGNYYWAIECDLYDPDEWEWKEIEKKLYDELSKLAMPNVELSRRASRGRP